MKLPISTMVAWLALASSGCSLLNPGNGGAPVNQGTGARPVGFVYTTLYGKNAVMEIDAVQSRANPDPIIVPNGPRALAIDPRGIQQYLYVVCQLANTVAVVDRRSRQVIRSINVGQQPFAIAVTPDGNRAFVTNSADDTVSVIDTVNNNVISTLQLNAFSAGQPGTTTPAAVRMRPQGIASNATGTMIYVACAGGYMVALQGSPPQVGPNGQVSQTGNAYSAVRNIPLPGAVQPLNVAVSTDNGQDSVYITDPQGNKIFYVAGGQGAAQPIQGNGEPWGVAVGHNAQGKNDKLYVTQSASGSVAQYDLPNLGGGTGASVEGHNPQAIAVSPDGQDVYVSITGDNSVADMQRTPQGALARPVYFNLTSLNQQFVTSTGELALGGYLF